MASRRILRRKPPPPPPFQNQKVPLIQRILRVASISPPVLVRKSGITGTGKVISEKSDISLCYHWNWKLELKKWYHWNCNWDCLLCLRSYPFLLVVSEIHSTSAPPCGSFRFGTQSWKAERRRRRKKKSKFVWKTVTKLELETESEFYGGRRFRRKLVEVFGWSLRRKATKPARNKW